MKADSEREEGDRLKGAPHPRERTALIGHESAEKEIIAAWNTGRLPHAFLIGGPEGIGKATLAYRIARFVLANRKPSVTDLELSADHPVARQVAALSHPDLLVLRRIAADEDKKAPKEISVAEVRRLVKFFGTTAAYDGYRICIVDSLDELNKYGANSLLKILEEPPDKTLFLLVTENEDQLLRTIVSRTQLVKVRAIADADLRDALMQRHELSFADAEKVAFQSDGSYATARQVINRNEQAAFNLATFQKWMRAALKFDGPKVISAVDELATVGRERQKNFLLYALTLVRESLLLNYADQSLVRMSGEELAFISKFAPFIHAANGEKFIEELDKAFSHIERNGNAKMIFLDLSFKANELLNIPKPQAV